MRVDIFYRSFTPGNRHGSTHWAIIFTLPICALAWMGVLGLRCGQLVSEEASPEPGGLPFVYLLRADPASSLLALQALSQLLSALWMYCAGCAVMEGQLALAMFVAVCAILLLGFPVALTWGTALGFAALGILIGRGPDYRPLTGVFFRRRNAGGRTALYPDGRRT